MLVYAGIDEAGYGPMLGPLCVACTVFVVPDHNPDVNGSCDLWKRLAKAVGRKRTDRRRRIAVDDSKKLKGANDAPNIHPLRHLERGVLAFERTIPPPFEGGGQGVGGANESTGASLHSPSTKPECPQCDHDLYRRLGVCVDGAPQWYATSTDLPVGQTADELLIAASRLRKTLHAEGVTCDFMRCQAIDAGDFNRQVQRMGSKASVNFCAVMRLIDQVWQRHGDHHPRIVVDRLGGRDHYLQDLMLAWPDASVQVLAETDTLSRYRLARTVAGRESMLTLSFLVQAEAAHLPVALASMTAKYVRELLMLRLNRYFRGLMPELKPTAGYTEDARRYLADIEALIAGLGIDRAALVRSV